MSKSLSSYPDSIRRNVIARRLAGPAGGNGYNGARDAARKLGINTPGSGGQHRPKKIKRRKEPQGGLEVLMQTIEDQVQEVGIV